MIKQFKFKNFYHPYAELMMEQLEEKGIKGLLKSKAGKSASKTEKALHKQQGYDAGDRLNFSTTYRPNYNVVVPPSIGGVPDEDFDFTLRGPFSTYNWEIFFHNPMLVAERLSQNQKFQEAQEWFHYVFDPTISEGVSPSRFWRLGPFAELSETPAINRLLAELSANPSSSDSEKLTDQIEVWKDNPFEPHVIAQMRVVSYMKYTVMKYLDNLIAWGDSLFRQDTTEAINEATQIYLLASSILGERPQKVSRKTDVAAMSYEDLINNQASGLDAFSNALVQLENGIKGGLVDRNSTKAAVDNGLGAINLLFFCVPNNKKFEEYWDTVADRLFKIRNCQNIDGVERQLSLFAPAIDPLQLVIAVGQGGSYQQTLRDLAAPLAPYRFSYMIQRALELCNDVKSLGGALLSALEKKDAEVISGIRNQHEIKVLDSLRNSKQLAIEESTHAIETLVQSKDAINYRHKYYNSKEYMNREERVQLQKLKLAADLELGVAKSELVIGTLEALPAISFGANGAFGSPHFATKLDGKTFSAIARASLSMIRALAQKERYKANKASIKAGHERRRDDWRFQAETAKIELAQVDKQIEGAKLRREIALYELELNERQLANATEIAEVMETKYTNEELYSWMITEISNLYLKSYQVALEVAKTAEQCFRFERPDAAPERPIIGNFNWNSLKKGLLAGDYLNKNLRDLQQRYDKSNQRRLELKKNVSLAIIDPEALIELRSTGTCSFDIPEILFDLDFPGHYKRRVKSVSISIPCIVGPNGNIPAKLTLGNNFVRNSFGSNIASDYQRNIQSGDDRFTLGTTGGHSIGTSTANRDAGVFELNFNDQRYLPFEGAGVVSNWTLELPKKEISQFDYDSISDVIMHISYEAEEGGKRTEVTDFIKSNMDEIVEGEDWSTMINLGQQFSSEMHQFLTPASGSDMAASFAIKDQHFPYLFSDKVRTTSNIEVVFTAKDNGDLSGGAAMDVSITDGPNTEVVTLTYDSDSKQLSGSFAAADWNLENLAFSSIEANNAVLNKDNIDDAILLVHFAAAIAS